MHCICFYGIIIKRWIAICLLQTVGMARGAWLKLRCFKAILNCKLALHSVNILKRSVNFVAALKHKK